MERSIGSRSPVSRSRSSSRSSQPGYCLETRLLAIAGSQISASAYRKGHTASLNFMGNNDQCCVVLEDSNEVLCCPPVEYIKIWSTVMYNSIDDRFKVEKRDDKPVVKIPGQFDAVVANAFFKYIYTWGDMVVVRKTFEEKCLSHSFGDGGYQRSDADANQRSDADEQKWFHLIQMAEYYDLKELTRDALACVSLKKEVMDDLCISLDRLVEVYTKRTLYRAGYPLLDILKICDCRISNAHDVIAGCLKHNIMTVREIVGEYEASQVILASVLLQEGDAHLPRSWYREVKKAAHERNQKCAASFIDIGFKSEELKNIGYSLYVLVQEISPARLEKIGFKPRRIETCIQRQEIAKTLGVSLDA